MARRYSKDSVKVIVEEKRREDVKDVATALEKELRDQGVKLSIDTAALYSTLLLGCGFDPDEREEN
jgi:hypothetical protein